MPAEQYEQAGIPAVNGQLRARFAAELEAERAWFAAQVERLTAQNRELSARLEATDARLAAITRQLAAEQSAVVQLYQDGRAQGYREGLEEGRATVRAPVRVPRARHAAPAERHLRAVQGVTVPVLAALSGAVRHTAATLRAHPAAAVKGPLIAVPVTASALVLGMVVQPYVTPLDTVPGAAATASPAAQEVPPWQPWTSPSSPHAAPTLLLAPPAAPSPVVTASASPSPADSALPVAAPPTVTVTAGVCVPQVTVTPSGTGAPSLAPSASPSPTPTDSAAPGFGW